MSSWFLLSRASGCRYALVASSAFETASWAAGIPSLLVALMWVQAAPVDTVVREQLFREKACLLDTARLFFVVATPRCIGCDLLLAGVSSGKYLSRRNYYQYYAVTVIRLQTPHVCA